MAEKGVFRHFLENADQKFAFFRRALPLKLLYIGAKGAFRKIVRSVTKIGYLKIVQRVPFGPAGGRIVKKGSVHPSLN